MPYTARPFDDLRGEIARSAWLLIEYLTRNARTEVLEYPFGYSFPRNCCESASIIFSYLLQEKYSLTDVAIIRGTKPRKFEHHFWVSTCGRLYGLTAHQFAGRRPIIGVERHSFFATYPRQEELYQSGFVDRGRIRRLYRRGIIPF